MTASTTRSALSVSILCLPKLVGFRGKFRRAGLAVSLDSHSKSAIVFRSQLVAVRVELIESLPHLAVVALALFYAVSDAILGLPIDFLDGPPPVWTYDFLKVINETHPLPLLSVIVIQSRRVFLLKMVCEFTQCADIFAP